jgi:hypothetical protein
MITIRLDDKNVVEKLKVIEELRKTGMFSEEQLQELYDKQLEKDKSESERKEATP